MSIRTERNIGDYKGLSDISHVYQIPDTFIGSTRKQPTKTLGLDFEKMKFKEIETDLPQGVQRIFLEILSNAGDNTDASRRAKKDPGEIKVGVTDKTITIQNGGLHIPVKKVKLEKVGGNTEVKEYDGKGTGCWLPEFIFGQFRSSNNYDTKVKRMGCGRNGFGSKLTNIFSKEFRVEVHDPDTNKIFIGTWRDNMFKDTPGKKPEIKIKNKVLTKGMVQISWDMDFDRFDMTEYTQDHIELFARFTVDFSFTCKVKTVFNGIDLDFRNILDYASLTWTSEQLENSFLKYAWEGENPLNSSTIKTQHRKTTEAKKAEEIADLEILVIDSPDNCKTISYVNGLMTVDGGVHLDAAQEPIFKFILKYLSSKKKKGSLTVKNIKPHLSFIVNARLADPEYTSQSKTKLTSPAVSCKYNDSVLKQLTDWGVIERLIAEIEAISLSKATKSDGSKRKHVALDKGEDANFAGTKKSSKCNLYLVEGLSAANYPQKRICMLEGGKDFNGYMPLKGKFLNVTKAKSSQYAENQVISSIKQVIGLREDLDYTDEANLKTLRYGFITLTVDADDDGMHILAHVLNFFREKFPGLLLHNMIGYLRTPVIKVFKGDKIKHRFFTVQEFETWVKGRDMKGLKVRYYKGLGTSNDRDIEDDLETAPTVICFYDEKCDECLDLAFHEDNTDERKEWIEKWRGVVQTDDVISVDISSISKGNKMLQGQDISQFINRELVGYSVASLFRAIPSEYDHLKDSQRKALWSALEYFKYDPKKGKSMKVGRFSNKAADMTQYHHGEKSLTDTFIKMAQDFIGSNNMGYFKKDGQFGTRADGGENAADARYSETHLAWWIPYVYYKESIDIVEKRVIDEEECEPLWLPGVIPMGIVNGTNGIATAFSTTTPCHNPRDVIDWYKQRCQGQKPTPITPWYKDFEGELEVVQRSSPTRKHVKKQSLVSKGKYEIVGFHKNNGPIVRVTEIPVKSWIISYRKWLEELVQKKTKPIFDYKDNSSTEKPYFLIDWNSDYKKINTKTLQLERSIGMSNITLIDHKGFPKRLTTIDEMMELYYQHMMQHYEEIREHRIQNEKNKVTDLSFKMKFIQLVLDDVIQLIKVSESEIAVLLEEHEIPFEYYEKSKSRDFSVESLERYKKQVAEAKHRLNVAEKTTASDIWIGKLNALEKEIAKHY